MCEPGTLRVRGSRTTCGRCRAGICDCLSRSYGPRLYLYAEMVFGNTFNIKSLIESTRQDPSTRCERRAR